MFRENNLHRQEELFTFANMNTKTQAKLEQSWAPLFYSHVFCAINEKLFAELFCADNGRPNFPVNILVALEIIKHWKDFTDEELLEQAAFIIRLPMPLACVLLVKLIFPVEHFICFAAGYINMRLNMLAKTIWFSDNCRSESGPYQNSWHQTGPAAN